MQPNVTPSFLIYFISSVLCCVNCQQHSEGEGHFMNEWAAEVPGGESVARGVAERHGMELVRPIGSLPNHYLFRHHRLAKRSVDSADEHHARFAGDFDVSWAEQQRVKRRVKRDNNNHSREKKAPVSEPALFDNFRDPLWPEQWYLHAGGIGHSDMRVREAWEQGATGKDVVVTILDDGIEHNHPDLALNYDPLASQDINDGDPDPMPRYDKYNENKHGTRCAGEVAAAADNNHCMVGVAYNAKIGGVRMLDGEVNDGVEASSLSLNPDHIDIYSASWGPDDNGQVVDGPGTLARKAFERGVTKGRGGKGSIFVWASGNGGRDKDSCSCDGYTNSIYTLSVSSASQNGRKPWYLEECASTLATTFSSGSNSERQIVSTDLHGKCTKEHTGTSASAPLAAGLCALALEVNPSLTWRDMQHIVVLTSNPGPLFGGANDWTTNGVGRNVSHVFGFGLMDAGAMVKLAKQWTSVSDQEIFIGHYDENAMDIPSSGDLTLDVVIDTRGQIGSLEHVQAEVTLLYHPRGALSIFLTSPMGTRSTLLPLRPRDNKSKLMAWRFLTVHCWGENPEGKWTLQISHRGSSGRGKLTSWRLILYGTREGAGEGANGRHIVKEKDVHHVQLREDQVPRFATDYTVTNVVTSGASGTTPISSVLPTPSCHSQCLERCHDETASGCYRCKNFRLGERGPCVEICGVNHFIRNETDGGSGTKRICENCHFSCASCSGPNANDCLQCPTSSFLDQFHQCLSCASPCQNCSDAPTECTSCLDGFHLEGSTCGSTGATVCEPGTYLDLSSSGGAAEGVGPGQCLSCHSSCASCTGSAKNECLSCPLGASLQNRSVCVQNCDIGYFASEGQCLPCTNVPTTCLSCLGPEIEDCVRCPTGWKVGPKGCAQLDCGSRLFSDVVQGGICSPCHASCLTCKGPQFVDCLSCPSETFLHKGKCVRKCPKSTYADKAENRCQECDASCEECSPPGRDTDCSSCHKGQVLFRGVCLPDRCGTGRYQDKRDDCRKCDASCLTCKGPGPGNCVTCQPGPYALHRPTSKCVPCCVPNTFDKDACCICRNPREKNPTCAEDIESPSPFNVVPTTSDPGVSPSMFGFLVSLIVFLIVVLPALIFITLQARANGWFCFGSYRYTPLDPSSGVRGLNNIERITLTEDDLRDEDELSDDLYVAPQFKDQPSDRSPLFTSAYAKESNASSDLYSNGIPSFSQQREPSSLSASFHVPLLDKPSSDLHYT